MRIWQQIKQFDPSIVSCICLGILSIVFSLLFAPEQVIALKFVIKVILFPLCIAFLIIRITPKNWWPYLILIVAAYSIWEVHTKIFIVMLVLGGVMALCGTLPTRYNLLRLTFSIVTILLLGALIWYLNRWMTSYEADRTALLFIRIFPLSGGGASSMAYHLSQNIQIVHQRGYVEAVEGDVTPYPLFWLYFGMPSILGLVTLVYTVWSKRPSVAQAIFFGMILAAIFLPSSLWLTIVLLFWLSTVVVLNDVKCHVI